MWTSACHMHRWWWWCARVKPVSQGLPPWKVLLLIILNIIIVANLSAYQLWANTFAFGEAGRRAMKKTCLIKSLPPLSLSLSYSLPLSVTFGLIKTTYHSYFDVSPLYDLLWSDATTHTHTHTYTNLSNMVVEKENNFNAEIVSRRAPPDGPKEKKRICFSSTLFFLFSSPAMACDAYKANW